MSIAVIPTAVAPARAHLVSDGEYNPALLGLLDSARMRLLCSLFIVDITATPNGGLMVDDLLMHLADARWRGVDVRLLVGGSRDNIALAEAADAARARARALGIDCRWLSSRNVRGSHAKLVIADDTVLTGSHNWSAGALSGEHQTQDSVMVASRDLAAVLAQRFEAQWQRAEVPHAAL